MSEVPLYTNATARHLHQHISHFHLQGDLAHKKILLLGPYLRPMPRVLGGSYGGGRFLMSEVTLQHDRCETMACCKAKAGSTGLPRS